MSNPTPERIAEWSYSEYRALLRKDGRPYAIVTPDGRGCLEPEKVDELLTLLNAHIGKPDLLAHISALEAKLSVMHASADVLLHNQAGFPYSSEQMEAAIATLGDLDAATAYKIVVDKDALKLAYEQGLEEGATERRSLEAKCRLAEQAITALLHPEKLNGFTYSVPMRQVGLITMEGSIELAESALTALREAKPDHL